MTSWNQTYFLFGQGIGLSVLLAVTPIFTILFLLGILRKAAWIAGLTGLAVAFALAIGAYRMPVTTAVSAAADGVAFGLFPISWIVFWAIALFRITVETGNFEIIRDSIGSLTTDSRLQALLIGFVFGGFLEGAAGFGTPVAIAATMLTGLGFSPFRASAICLLANTVPVAFGSIGIPIYALAGTTGLPLGKLSAAVGAICTPMTLMIPTYLIAATEGLNSLSGIMMPVLLTSLVFAGIQLWVSVFMGPQLADILAALGAMVAFVLYLRYRGKQDREAMLRLSNSTGTIAGGLVSNTVPNSHPAHSGRTIFYAWLPYGLLVVCVLLWGWAPLQTILNRFTLAVPFPFLHDVVQRIPPVVPSATPYHAIFNLNWLSTPGTACMVATFLSAICSRMKLRNLLQVLAGVARQLCFPTITVTSVLAIAFLMNYCGATATLGLAIASTGAAFPFFSSLLGWIGTFLTGSDTSSNALFGNLQVVTANKLGLSATLMAAANSSGGVMGKMISLQTIAIASAATGLDRADEARLFRFTFKHSVLLATIVGCITLLYAYGFHFG